MLFLLPVLAMAADPPSHSLELEAVPTETGFDARVTNPTKKPVWLQITLPDYNVAKAVVRDAAGTELRGESLYGTAGAPLWTYRFERLEPGASVVVRQWSFDDRQAVAMDGANRWDLRAQRGTTLSIGWTFELLCSERKVEPTNVPAMPGADNAAPPRNVDKVFCGRLASDAVDFPVPDWSSERILEGLKWGTVEAAMAFDVLVANALGHDDPTVRENAVVSLHRLGDARAVQALVARLEDEDREVRGNAARALEDLGDASALPALQRLAPVESDDWVKSEMYDAMKALGG